MTEIEYCSASTESQIWAMTIDPPSYAVLLDYEEIVESPQHQAQFEDLISTLHHSLRAARRRHVIELMMNTPDSSVSMRFLARTIAAHEQEIPVEAATGEPYRNVYSALSQTHLPTLAEADILNYDSQRQAVSPASNYLIAAFLVSITRQTAWMFSEHQRRWE